MSMNLIKHLYEFDTAEISDALDACGIHGALLGIKPICYGRKIVGPAFTVKYLPYEQKPDTFQNAGNYIDDVTPQSVVIIDNNGREDCTVWGDILTQVAMKRELAGTVIYGAARDLSFILKTGYPLFTSATYMRSGKNRVFKSTQQCDLLIGNIRVRPGDIIIGDDNGVLVVPKEHLASVVEKARNIKATEEAIILSIKNGMRLDEARKKHRYDQPWTATKG